MTKFLREHSKVTSFGAGILALILVGHAVSLAQAKAKSRAPAPVKMDKSLEAKPVAVPAHTADTPDMVRETQLGVSEPGHAGLIWWIPFEFWINAATKRGVSSEQAAKQFISLKDYTVVGIMAAEVSSFGAFTFIPPEKLRKGVILRDSSGQEYTAIGEPSPDAKNLAAMMKPILSNCHWKSW
jgi:hypothetical protein